MTLTKETIKELGQNSRAWPFEEARKILERLGGKTPEKGYVLFETGYGPSGLPHIGTFGEIARTLMVRHAFENLSDIPTRLFCISDDMDGMRKVPDNLPQQEMLKEHLHLPLTKVPDPFGTHGSYGEHMNNRLCQFLDHYGFDYEFKSSSELYKNGTYDEKLLTILKNHQQVLDIMLPTLGDERRATYSPFLPISPKTGHVLQVKIESYNIDKGTVSFYDDGELTEVPVTGGHCKLQWKPDMGMRWAALDVDYEMYGKDHLASAPLYSTICVIAGGISPSQMNYELFLDEKGQKISKSKGNGITIDEWLKYAPTESLLLYMFQAPRKAKRLHFDVIPKQVDNYLTFLKKYHGEEPAKKLENPSWHIHTGNPPKLENTNLSFNLLLNLASACNPEDKNVLWGFISRYAPDANPENSPTLDNLANHAVTYYNDFVKPTKEYRPANENERNALEALREKFATLELSATAEEIQNEVYAVGNEYYGEKELRNWFKAIYEILLGASQGPRFGSLYGLKETIAMIDDGLNRKIAA
jgi:lysyl-tRNA synthetase class 1